MAGEDPLVGIASYGLIRKVTQFDRVYHVWQEELPSGCYIPAFTPHVDVASLAIQSSFSFSTCGKYERERDCPARW